MTGIFSERGGLLLNIKIRFLNQAFINFRATSSGLNCSKNIYTTTDFNKYVSPVYDSVLPETNETDNVSPVYDSVLPETNETDNLLWILHWKISLGIARYDSGSSG
jgi:hypothetical protein